MGVDVITFSDKGSFDKTEKFLKKMSKMDIYSRLESIAREGVSALSTATPLGTGLTAASWDYEVKITKNYAQIYWTNKNTVDGTPVAVLLQYGHATGTGGYVSGRDYINPTMKPFFDKLAENVWKAVTSA